MRGIPFWAFFSPSFTGTVSWHVLVLTTDMREMAGGCNEFVNGLTFLDIELAFAGRW